MSKIIQYINNIINPYFIELNFNLKYWGKKIEYKNKGEVTPYFRFYFIFIYFNIPQLID